MQKCHSRERGNLTEGNAGPGKTTNWPPGFRRGDKSINISLVLKRGVSPLTGEVLLLVLPRRSTQEESAPAAPPGCAGCSALLGCNGGCATRPYGAQTVLALFPLRPALLDDAEGMSRTDRIFFRQRLCSAGVRGFPCGAPSNAGEPGVVGEHCLRAVGPSCAAAPSGAKQREEVLLGCPVATEQRRAPGAAGRRGRRDFFLSTSAWQDKKKYLAVRAKLNLCTSENIGKRHTPLSPAR